MQVSNYDFVREIETGIYYANVVDADYDCSKMFHYIVTEDGKEFPYSHSPYSMPGTSDLRHASIKLGLINDF